MRTTSPHRKCNNKKTTNRTPSAPGKFGKQVDTQNNDNKNKILDNENIIGLFRCCEGNTAPNHHRFSIMARTLLTRSSVALVVIVCVNLLLFQWFASQLSELHSTVFNVERDVVSLKQDLSSLQKQQEQIKLPSLSDTPAPIVDNKHNSIPTTPFATTTTELVDQQALIAKRYDDIKLLPIVVFCYNRPEYLRRTLETLFK